MSDVAAGSTNLPTPPVFDVDPFSVEFLRDPTNFQERLRNAGPVVYVPKHACYAVGRYAEVKAAFSDWERFSSAAGTGLGHIGNGGAWRPPGPIVEVDPPDHTRMRGVLNRILSPAVVRSWRASFEAGAEQRVAEVVAKGTFDGVRDLVEPYVLTVFPDALGISSDGRENLLEIGDLTGNALGPANNLFLASNRRVEPLMPWFNAKFERSAMLPGGFGEKIWAAADAGEIDIEKVPALMRTFLRGGADTVISGISSTLWLFATNPAQWNLLRANPSLARAAFDEAIRLETPAQCLFRTTNGAIEFSGYRLEHDLKVLCSRGAANRDPARWDNDGTFNITRQTSGHLALGVGMHVCIGQMVARLEAESILSALLRHIDRIELAGPPAHRLNNTARRLEKLPLRVTPKPAAH